MSSPEVQSAICSALRTFQHCLSRGELKEALVAVEQVAHTVLTASVSEAWKVTKRIATLSNRLSSLCPIEQAMDFLHRADSVLDSYSKRLLNDEQTAFKAYFRLRNLTWNNIATWHRKRNSLHMALHYLMKAFKLSMGGTRLSDCESLHSIAQTRLNMSAIYCEMNRHREAVDHAEGALLALQQEMSLRKDKKRVRKKAEAMLTLFVVAFYSIGVGEEAMGHRAEAIEAYTNAVGIGQKHLKVTNRALFVARKALNDLKSAVEGTIVHRKQRPKSMDREIFPVASQTGSPCASQNPTSPIELVPSHKRALTATERLEPKKPLSRGSSHRSLHDKHPELPRGRSVNSLLKDIHVLDDEKDKYYSRGDLVKLLRKREEGAKLDFVSSDQFFLAKITKQLNVSKDIQHLRPLSACNAMGAWEKDEEEKRLVSALRLKRHPQSSRRSSEHGLEAALKLVNRLKEEDQMVSKRNTIKIQSRMKTKAYRQALQDALKRRDSAFSSQSFPPQRLFFKVHGDNSPDRTAPYEDSKTATEVIQMKVVLPPAKEEIEKMMDELNSELKAMSEPQEREAKSEMKKHTCDLAASAIHRGYVKTIAHKTDEEVSSEKVERLASIVSRKKSALKAALQAVATKPSLLFPY